MALAVALKADAFTAAIGPLAPVISRTRFADASSRSTAISSLAAFIDADRAAVNPTGLMP
jgi:hypothetical protein